MPSASSLPYLDLSTLPKISNRDMLLNGVDFAGKDVVDIGCGDGRLARLVADVGQARQVTGIECSPRQLAKAHSLPAHDRVQIIEGVAQNLPLDDHSVDVAIFFNSLHHVPASVMDQGFRETCRVLRPGGLIYIGEPVAVGSFFQVCQPVDDETEVRALAQEAIARACSPESGLSLQIVSDDYYIHRLTLPSFEAFRERITSANSERDAIFAQKDQDLRALFNDLADIAPQGGFAFDQPGHRTILQYRGQNRSS